MSESQEPPKQDNATARDIVIAGEPGKARSEIIAGGKGEGSAAKGSFSFEPNLPPPPPLFKAPPALGAKERSSLHKAPIKKLGVAAAHHVAQEPAPQDIMPNPDILAEQDTATAEIVLPHARVAPLTASQKESSTLKIRVKGAAGQEHEAAHEEEPQGSAGKSSGAKKEEEGLAATLNKIDANAGRQRREVLKNVNYVESAVVHSAEGSRFRITPFILPVVCLLVVAFVIVGAFKLNSIGSEPVSMQAPPARQKPAKPNSEAANLSNPPSPANGQPASAVLEPLPSQQVMPEPAPKDDSPLAPSASGKPKETPEPPRAVPASPYKPSASNETPALQKEIETARRRAISGIKAKHGEQTIVAFKDFLKSKGLSGAALAVKLCPLAQSLATPAFSQSCLDELQKEPEFSEAYRVLALRHKMVYSNELPADSEFDGLGGQAARDLRLLCMVSRGEFDAAMLLPTPSGETTDFWKIFLSWRTNSAGWDELAKEYLGSCPDADINPKAIIVKVWLEMMRPEDARALVNQMLPADASLLSILLAENFRKQGNPVAAKVLYLKALREQLNPYRALALRLRDS